MADFEKGFQALEGSNEDHTALFEQLESLYDSQQLRSASKLLALEPVIVEEV